MRAPASRLATGRFATGLLAVAVLAFGAGCGATPVTATAVSTSPQRVEFHFAGGVAQGGVARVQVALGATVVLVLTSDVDEDLHLHGYDRLAVVRAGGSGSLTFVADLPGVFAAEAERAGVPLARIEVR